MPIASLFSAFFTSFLTKIFLKFIYFFSCLLTEGENCDACNCLAGQVFPISDARVGENFAPMHSNCNCRVGILDDAGRIAYVISEGKSEKKEEETNWYDAFLRMPQDAKELFLSFVRAQNERLGQKDVAGFLDWLTMGIVSGTWQGYQDRYQELLNDPTLYNFVNYLTSGFADTVKGAIKPEEPLSLQHWLDSLGTASTAFGAYQMGKSVKTEFSSRNTSKTVDVIQPAQRVYTANGDEVLRSIRRPIFDDVLEKGIDINGTHFKMNKHAYNSLFKSGRKDIMPDDIVDALKIKPIPASPGSIEYVNPVTGTSVFVNSANNEIVGIWPAEFKK